MTEEKKQDPVVIQGKDDSYSPQNEISLAEAEASGFIPAKDISEFATLVVAWHTHIVNQGRHLLALDNQNPDDPQKVLIHVFDPTHAGADETGYRVLEDSELPAFKHGARWLLDLIEDLPFNYVPTDADNNPKPGFGADEPVAEQ